MLRKLFFTVLVLTALAQSAQQAQTQQPSTRPNPPAQATQAAQAADHAAPSRTMESSLTAGQFAELIDKFSEPNGYFDTDNLISNESSYLHVLGKMRQMKVTGGAYIGVGPDQSFSYIAQIRPKIAFIVDIRRDNLLQHLLFKSLFALSRNRIEYLCLLFGKPAPADLKSWESSSVLEITSYLDKAPAKKELFDASSARIQARVKSFGLKLEESELATITRIHQAFFDAGLDLKFTSRNRPPRYYYPNYRDLLLEKDLTGKHGNYLANEDDFQFLKNLEERNQVIPLVGNLAGSQTIKSIAQYLKQRGERVSAFYTSNVEFYLMREDDFDRFAENVGRLPRDERSLIIRSYFNGTWGYPHPQSVVGYYSTQLLQTFESFVREYAAGGLRSYTDIVSKHSLELR